MQNQQERSTQVHFDRTEMIKVARLLWRVRKDPTAMEPVLAIWRAKGATEADLAADRTALIAWRKTILSRQALARIDRYLAASTLAIDALLLPVMVSLNEPARSYAVAHVTWIISAVLVAIALFVSYVNQDEGITTYGTLHRTVVELGLLAGAVTLSALFWHTSPFVGILFFVLTLLGYIVCGVYYAAAKMMLVYDQLQGAHSAPALEARTLSAATEPGRSAPTHKEHEAVPPNGALA